MNGDGHFQTTIATAVTVNADTTPRRRPLYFRSGTRNIFGWYHAANPQLTRDCAVVICNPLGFEYTHGHRSLRHLAEELAANGFACLRFDYDATGDSPTPDLAGNRVSCWLEDIRSALATLRSLSGSERVGLLGLRMGAVLAAAVASSESIPIFILWAPCNSKQYVREMKVVARAAAGSIDQKIGFESGGFTLLHETAEQLSAIDLKSLPFKSPASALLLQRDDVDIDHGLEQHLRECGIDVIQIETAGYAEMMTEPQFTEVPFTAIAHIVEWLKNHSTPSTRTPNGLNAITAYETTTVENGVELIEHCYEFGDQHQLFGIVTTPKTMAVEEGKPAVVMLNSGSVHRVGPNRLYVELTRSLAARGLLCLRFDLQGLGDSALTHAGTENNAYPRSAISDTSDALQFLKKEFRSKHFVLIGLCSGAHAAMHAAIGLPDIDITAAMLINPLTFRYVEGMSLATSRQFQDVEHYKKSARSAQKWLKLLRGQVDLLHVMKLGQSQLKLRLASLKEMFYERFFLQKAPPLAQDLTKLQQLQRPLRLFIAEGDPGYILLKNGARYTSSRLVKNGFIRVNVIANANHTFSKRKPREELIEMICDELSSSSDK